MRDDKAAAGAEAVESRFLVLSATRIAANPRERDADRYKRLRRSPSHPAYERLVEGFGTVPKD